MLCVCACVLLVVQCVFGVLCGGSGDGVMVKGLELLAALLQDWDTDSADTAVRTCNHTRRQPLLSPHKLEIMVVSSPRLKRVLCVLFGDVQACEVGLCVWLSGVLKQRGHDNTLAPALQLVACLANKKGTHTRHVHRAT